MVESIRRFINAYGNFGFICFSFLRVTLLILLCLILGILLLFPYSYYNKNALFFEHFHCSNTNPYALFHADFLSLSIPIATMSAVLYLSSSLLAYLSAIPVSSFSCIFIIFAFLLQNRNNLCK